VAAKKKPAPKRGASRYQAPAKKPVPGWFWLVCGLVVGGFMVFLFRKAVCEFHISFEDIKYANNQANSNTF
jgi:hypothetical protein